MSKRNNYEKTRALYIAKQKREVNLAFEKSSLFYVNSKDITIFATDNYGNFYRVRTLICFYKKSSYFKYFGYKFNFKRNRFNYLAKEDLTNRSLIYFDSSDFKTALETFLKTGELRYETKKYALLRYPELFL